MQQGPEDRGDGKHFHHGAQHQHERDHDPEEYVLVATQAGDRSRDHLRHVLPREQPTEHSGKHDDGHHHHRQRRRIQEDLRKIPEPELLVKEPADQE